MPLSSTIEAYLVRTREVRCQNIINIERRSYMSYADKKVKITEFEGSERAPFKPEEVKMK